MKSIILHLIVLLFFGTTYSQTLMEVALKDRSILVSEDPIEINLGNFEFKAREFYGHLGILGKEFPKNDSTELKILLNKTIASEPNLSKWTEREIPNRILVNPDENINPKVGLETVEWSTKKEKKAILNEIRAYNNKNTLWPNSPVYVSRPVFSQSGKYAIVGLINGGSTGKTSLYKKNDGIWFYVSDLYSWVY